MADASARLLLVDDHPSLLLALETTLTEQLPHVTVDTCRSGWQAIERLAAIDYDVIISDILMPHLNGLALLARARAMRPMAPVILITGADDDDLTLKALRGGAYDFILKPVEPRYFARSVERAIETCRLRRAIEAQQDELKEHAGELERVVEERTRDLLEANRLKDEFLATVSHELRTPLTPILGWARLLKGRRLSGPAVEQALDSIERNARAQAQLVDDLLDVSRIVTGKLRLDVHVVSLESVLSSAIDVVAASAQAKEVAIERRGNDAGSIRLAADPERLGQVFWNLLMNAVKFTPRGGTVSIEVSVANELVEVTVADSGCGIQPSFLPFVFDRFRQAGSSEARGGLGLGLSIARHLVELHRGTISASSEGVGKGSRFTVSMPVEKVATSSPRSRFTTRPDLTRDDVLLGVSALIVEDEADAQGVLIALLEDAGAEVTAVATAADAFVAIRRTRPDVVICDIGLGDPNEDGYELIKKVRALPSADGGDTPALALTAFAKPEARAMALAAGFQLHFAKPGPPDLPSIVAALARGALD